MESDLALTLGLIVWVFAIPSVVSALSARRSPRASAMTVLIGGALVLYAVATKPGGYAIGQVPDVFFGVIGRFIN